MKNDNKELRGNLPLGRKNKVSPAHDKPLKSGLFIVKLFSSLLEVQINCG
jgi:hypothetical protein